MADEAFSGVGTHQYVAWKLLEVVGEAEKKADRVGSSGVIQWNKNADEAWILDTYVRCLRATRGGRE